MTVHLPYQANAALRAFDHVLDRGDVPVEALADGTLDSPWVRLMEAVPEQPGTWERRDLTAFLAPGADASAYRVVVPVTGGMDSSTLWAMAAEAGLPALPVYVDVGQAYASAEMDTFRDLFGRAPVRLDAPLIGRRWDHILPARNAVILLRIAETMTMGGWWGEVWFGNLAGETPALVGDKSARFLATTQQLLAALGHDVQIVSPLRGLDKTDLVRWWAARDDLDRLRRTKSCFHPTLRACGACQTCFRKMVAFRAAGESTDGMFAQEAWAPFVAKYEPAMVHAETKRDWTRYSPRRCYDTLNVIGQLRREGKV